MKLDSVKIMLALGALLSAATWGAPAAAQDGGRQVGEMTLSPEDADELFRSPGYSPYAGRSFPTQVYWGDTHVRSSNSLDARAFGVTLGPEVPPLRAQIARLTARVEEA